VLRLNDHVHRMSTTVSVMSGESIAIIFQGRPHGGYRLTHPVDTLSEEGCSSK
jgi:hypothetical protein